MNHDLKTDPDCFAASWDGRKPFEVRKNDRGFNEGDVLHLMETRWTGAAMADGKPLEYTGRFINATVQYVLRGPRFGIAEGWCVMGARIWECGHERDVHATGSVSKES